MHEHEQDKTDNNWEISTDNHVASKSDGDKESENDEDHNKHIIKTPEQSVTQSLR